MYPFPRNNQFDDYFRDSLKTNDLFGELPDELDEKPSSSSSSDEFMPEKEPKQLTLKQVFELAKVDINDYFDYDEEQDCFA